MFVLLSYDFILYLRYVGDPERILQFIAYEQFNLQLLVAVTILWFPTVHWFVKTVVKKYDDNANGLRPPFFSLQALPDTICNKHIHFSNILYGMTLFIAPVGNMIIMGFVFMEVRDRIIEDNDEYQRKCINTMILFRSGEIPGVFFYGWFTFLLYMTRKRYHNSFAKVAAKSINDDYTVEKCKADITKKWLELKVYRSLAGWWLCFTITITSLSLTTQILWISAPEFQVHASEPTSQLVEVAMACQNTMFLVQSLYAVGGFDVDTIWFQFKEHYKENYNEFSQQQQLHTILKHLNKIYSRGPWLYTAVVLAIGTIFAAISIPVQMVQLWVRPNCSLNETETNITATSYYTDTPFK